MKEESDRVWDPEETGETKSTGPLKQEDGCTYELTETVATYTEPSWIYIKWGPSTERKFEQILLSPNQKLSPVDNYVQVKI